MHVVGYAPPLQHLPKYYMGNNIKESWFCSGSVQAGDSASSKLVSKSLAWKWLDSRGNYMLIGELSQTLNEGLFQPYCKLYNKCN